MIGLDFSKVTVQDCIDMFEKRKCAVLNDGKMIAFVED